MKPTRMDAPFLHSRILHRPSASHFLIRSQRLTPSLTMIAVRRRAVRSDEDGVMAEHKGGNT